MTAMMAFFLLMWLLGSINTAELSGIADYFKMPLRTALLGGKRTSEGANVITAGGLDLMKEEGVKRWLERDDPFEAVVLESMAGRRMTEVIQRNTRSDRHRGRGSDRENGDE